MSTQLKEKINGEWQFIYPITTLDAIKDIDTNKNIKDIFKSYNHIYLPSKNNKKDTRLQVPHSMRRRGLFITYECKNGHLITEYYNSDSVTDYNFGDCKNWVHYLNNDLTREIINERLSWYILD